MSLDQLHDLPETIQQTILDGPALAPPPGTIPNLDDPPNQNALGLAVTTICLSISTVTVLLATYAKLHGGRKPRYEDCVIWKLKIKIQKKIGVAFIFLLGIFAVVSAALRVDASIQFFRSKDKTYIITSVALWGIAELTCGILIYCVPAIPGILRDSNMSLQSFTTMVPRIKSPFIRNSGSLRPSFGNERLSPDSLWGPNYDDSVASRVYNPEKPQLRNQRTHSIQQFQPSPNQDIV
ncbi:hypothetical protein F4680DRAFT_472083 [Xylaria scruposa]|nr:hypothetical protein F4680DRAFT_472083 [Xylaria scruposa]